MKRFAIGPDEHWLYGLCITAACTNNVFTGPILGAIYDKTHACKLLVTIAGLSAALGTIQIALLHDHLQAWIAHAWIAHACMLQAVLSTLLQSPSTWC